ncbi:hypothetical protein [Thermus scotoductus]|nr:hypothetical protein [Thermus scotoductus]
MRFGFAGENQEAGQSEAEAKMEGTLTQEPMAGVALAEYLARGIPLEA